jgi:hypothetical protein
MKNRMLYNLFQDKNLGGCKKIVPEKHRTDRVAEVRGSPCLTADTFGKQARQNKICRTGNPLGHMYLKFLDIYVLRHTRYSYFGRNKNSGDRKK